MKIVQADKKGLNLFTAKAQRRQVTQRPPCRHRVNLTIFNQCLLCIFSQRVLIRNSSFVTRNLACLNHGLHGSKDCTDEICAGG